MSTLSELLAEHTGLSGAAAVHLQLVVSEWQLLSDLSFADFLLWITPEAQPTAPEAAPRFLCVAQVRPTTGPTAHPKDMVGSVATAVEHPQLQAAVESERICREESPRWQLGVPVRRETIPVRFGGEVIAVLSRDTNLATARVPSPLEISYLGSAADLCQMIAEGAFPSAEPSPGAHTSPRAGDGLIRIDATGSVLFASPNAQSAYHRMGHAADLVGTRLGPLSRSLITDPFDANELAQRIKSALDGKPSPRMEAEGRGATVLFRALPLRPRGKAAGALVLVRDVTEVKRRDRALISKDATIREIHHRVKNNLQTVAALLRLQARRTGNAEARLALEESMRRVSSIALVHENLSMSLDERVDFDDLIDRMIPMMSDVAVVESHAKIRREGQFGIVPAELATPLVMVLTELVQNAVEHAFVAGQTGEVVVSGDRSTRWLDVAVTDNGRGLPAGFSLERADRLGLQIVRTLAESELRGSLSLRNQRVGTGTEAVLRIPMKIRR